MKRFADAKQRLSGLLDDNERQALARAMFADLLDRLAAAPTVAGTIVVTSEEQATERARALGATVLTESVEAGQSAGVARGATFLAAAGEARFMTMPADLPLVTATDIETVIAAHPPGRGVTLVPAHDHYGTNAVLVSPPDGLAFRFGPDSLNRHLREARAAGLPVRVRKAPNFGLDIDTPRDLAELIRRGPKGRVARELAAVGLIERFIDVETRPAPGVVDL